MQNQEISMHCYRATGTSDIRLTKVYCTVVGINSTKDIISQFHNQHYPTIKYVLIQSLPTTTTNYSYNYNYRVALDRQLCQDYTGTAQGHSTTQSIGTSYKDKVREIGRMIVREGRKRTSLSVIFLHPNPCIITA